MSLGGLSSCAELESGAGAVQTDVAIVAERQRMMEEWKEWYDTKREWLEWHTQGLQRLLGDRLNESDYTVEEVETETTLSTTEEVLKS